jgi:hypothetical protein
MMTLPDLPNIDLLMGTTGRNMPKTKSLGGYPIQNQPWKKSMQTPASPKPTKETTAEDFSKIT